jgi:phosphonopyruvate decarboxylase
MSNTIAPAEFYQLLGHNDIDLYTGVPDSLLADLCAYVEDTAPAERNIITANEGNAVALAGGYHIATGKYAVVYLQNSGLGNTVNPLLSLADSAVYGLPMLMVIGWRGEPGVKDEPQHVTQGRLNNPMLETMEIEYQVLDPQGWQGQVAWAVERMGETNKPVALVVRKGIFEKYAAAERATDLSLSIPPTSLCRLPARHRARCSRFASVAVKATAKTS